MSKTTKEIRSYEYAITNWRHFGVNRFVHFVDNYLGVIVIAILCVAVMLLIGALI